MSFEKESLSSIQNRIYNNYMSLFRPLEKTPRYNILKVLAACEAGAFHQLSGDLSFLSKQIFPDTATGDYLRLHWSGKVQPLYASIAVGTIIQTGNVGGVIPAGTIYSSPNGKRYYSDRTYRIDETEHVEIRIFAEEPGSESNIGAGTELTISTSIPNGVDSKATVVEISGGIDEETDEEYLNRVILYERNVNRNGKPGDFAAWAIDSSTEVSKAWEIKGCYGVFGALLIAVLGGNHIDGIRRVFNTDSVYSYIKSQCPPVLFAVRSPELVELHPTIHLLSEEDTAPSRASVESRLKSYLEAKAKPGCIIRETTLKSVCADGFLVTVVQLSIAGGDKELQPLQYPVLGDITWV